MSVTSDSFATKCYQRSNLGEAKRVILLVMHLIVAG
jgi:hypothetical protein